MDDHRERDRILAEALPYVSRVRGRHIVVKIGGAPLRDPVARQNISTDLIWLTELGIRVVVVHGGGPQISEMLDRLGIESRFVDGQRYTDKAVLEVIEMVLGGAINKALVRTIAGRGGRAIGLTGVDARMAVAEVATGAADLGLVGHRPVFDTLLLRQLPAEVIPVIAPLAVSAKGQLLNVNSDVFAAHLAAALSASKLVVVTDVQGVRGSSGQILPTISVEQVFELIAEGVIDGDMIAKLGQATVALRGGVEKVHIIDGRRSHSLLIELFSHSGIGTQVIAKFPDSPGTTAL